MAPVEETTAGGEGVTEEDKAGSLGTGSGGYVPPHLRKGGAAAGEKMGGRFEKDDLATLRVTNVRAYILEMLFGAFSNFFLLLSTGQRVGRGTRDAGSLRAVRSCHQSFPCPGQRDPEGQGLRFHLLRRSDGRTACLRQNGRLYVAPLPTLSRSPQH